jgi:hypothetical protein
VRQWFGVVAWAKKKTRRVLRLFLMYLHSCTHSTAPYIAGTCTPDHMATPVRSCALATSLQYLHELGTSIHAGGLA